ncbi:hypothetical protein IRJ41_014800 [Triplophysa rosa]|uniref:Uncharacterized protein n=1 Tax=Triplophysa rosa TaxID=992332 RepID=A0A9W7WBN3_TRIRA|nr:hypothetical protein IRJ41_014800 [Triplophysa rosa]
MCLESGQALCPERTCGLGLFTLALSQINPHTTLFFSKRLQTGIIFHRNNVAQGIEMNLNGSHATEKSFTQIGGTILCWVRFTD